LGFKYKHAIIYYESNSKFLIPVKTMPVKTLKYKNSELTIVWKPEVCIHSALCRKGLPEVFDPKRRPWIAADAAPSEKIIDQINKCPSGALSYFMNNAATTDPEQVSPGQHSSIIECTPNGPLIIKGEIIIKKSDGTEEKKTGTVALCRCGSSQNKPYCDGGHKKVGFTG
jgi:uncharacterized Fe-S cluster protein YjdI